jgi:anti-sigma-K factor RskA
MAGMEQPPDEVLDLLVKELTEGLSADEHRVLAAAAPQATNDYRRGLERTAAAINLAAASTDSEPLPAVLRARLEHEAQVYFSARVAPAANEPSPAPAAAKQGIGRGPAGGWWAAAACLLLALFAWNRSPKTGATPVETARRETPVPEPTPQMQRAALIARADTLKIPLGATKDPAAAGVSGDVVWDGRAQRGYLRLVGLRHNDPSVQQYQMWIFDGDRDARYPVDGGLFDAPTDGQEVVIPIHNLIPVHSPKAFAVTVEKAGGVVVSARDHVIVLGQTT